MIKRCANTKSQNYRLYGGRGIYVCDRWGKFENFLLDMGEAPRGLSLDRIDSNGPYSPDNCRWATAKQQSQNSRQPILVTFHGETMNYTEWGKRIGIKGSNIKWRIDAGWPLEIALTTPRVWRRP